MHFRKAILILFFLAPGLITAQQRVVYPSAPVHHATLQERVDISLKKIIRIKSDTARATAYGLLSRMYADSVKDTVKNKINFDHAVLYAKTQLQIATKANWNKGIVYACCNMAYTYPYSVNPGQAIFWFEKAAGVANTPLLKNEAMLQMSEVYSHSGKVAKARDMLMSLLPYFKKNGSVKDVRDTYNQLSVCGISEGNVNEFLRWQLLAIDTYPASDTSAGHLKQLNVVATAYFFKNDLLHSLDLLQKAEKLMINGSSENNIAKVDIYLQLANIYGVIGDYKRELEISLKTLALIQSQSNYYGYPLHAAFSAIAYQYAMLKDYDNALAFAEKSIAVAKTGSTPEYSAYTAMAISYLGKKNYALALKAAKTGVDILKTGVKEHKITMVGKIVYEPEVLGEIYMEAPDTVLTNAGIPLAARYQMAVDIFKENIEASKSVSIAASLPPNYLDMSKAYGYLHDDAKALEAYKAYVAAKDTVAKQQDKSALMQKELQFNYSKREDSLRYKQLLADNQLQNQLKLSNQQKDIEQLKNQKIAVSLQSEQNQRRANEEKLKATQKEQALSQVTVQLQKADLSARKAQSYFLMGGIGLALLLSLLIARGYLQQRKSNRTISHTNKLLNEQQEEIIAQRDQLSEAFTELKQTQQQLIQAEKMASLGELTSGIAHEIQNPLNFVNNFSDVNREMIAELQAELKNGNLEEAIMIAEDIGQNEAKIHHHGKRADGIVKGMLQHSRTNAGQKELTDINKLADETLRLAYHTFQSSHSAFTATLKTNFDAALPEVNVVPQDIGRVLSNLLNNAFYAINEKAQAVTTHVSGAGNEYHPAIELETTKTAGNIEIRVRDNGNGVPNAIKDKIMQPFFTTKPTGEGTGLGLSLSYDIITKAYNGKLSVNSRDGEGAEFVVSLPVG